jgi:AbrB family looped-hinge helix DNA binding protein
LEKHAKITSKGRITVPLAIRRALGVRAGDVLLFEEDKTGVKVRPVRAKSPFAKYRGSAIGESAPERKRSFAGHERCAKDDDLEYRISRGGRTTINM